MAKKAPKADGETEGKGKGKLKLIIIVLVALLLLGASAGAAWWFLLRDKGDEGEEKHAAPAAAEAAAPAHQPALYEALTPAFVVNFKHEGRQRYMQVSVALMARDQVALDALKVHMPMLRNRLVMLFSSQEFTQLTTAVGMEMLRQQATASVQELAQKEVGKVVVEQVLFTNFVLQ